MTDRRRLIDDVLSVALDVARNGAELAVLERRDGVQVHRDERRQHRQAVNRLYAVLCALQAAPVVLH
jgi:hypothetical protein